MICLFVSLLLKILLLSFCDWFKYCNSSLVSKSAMNYMIFLWEGLSHSPIFCNNNAMDMAFLVQIRQSNKCGSVRNDEIINLHLGSGAGPWVSIPCLLQDTSHIYWLHSPKTSNQKKTNNPEIRLNFQQIILYCLGLRTQNPGLRAELSPNRGSDKISMQKQGRKTPPKKQVISCSLDSHIDHST